MNYRLYKVKKGGGRILPKWKAKFFKNGQYFKAATLFTDKGRSRDRAEELCRTWEREEAEKAAGIPVISPRPIHEIITDYLNLRSLKGKAGRPWSIRHKLLTEQRLGYWVRALSLKTLSDIRLMDVERALGAMGLSTETLNGYFHALDGFIRWCIRSRIMPYNPLLGFQAYQRVPVYSRAAFTVSEIRALLAAAKSPRREAYTLALLTGMRLGELNSLKVCDLEPGRGLIKLSAAAAKNRREAWFYIPQEFIPALVETLKGKGTQDKMLDLNRRGAEIIHLDMARAGLEWETPRGILDFHSLRATFATWLNEYGADLKVIQDLMRHASPIVTMERYTKANEERRRQTVDIIAGILPNPARERHSERNTGGTPREKTGNGK